ncbi:MAG: membrane dipeptidase [Oscillospiraceae bacterium]|nr:membrane dipeptidase [Oscillospiraceae bacterium]
MLTVIISMKFFDLHCDTLYRAISENKNMNDSDLCVTFEKIKQFEEYQGCFAIWMSDSIYGKDAFNLFKLFINKFNLEKNKYISNSEELNRKIKIFLGVEGGGILGGELSNVKEFYKSGVRIFTLTWNGSCEIGDGVGVDNAGGITDFGIKVIKELNLYNMTVDVSHASERLFYDVYEIFDGAFIATHSNSKTVCNHRRNLTDEQFRIIQKRGGIVGINFCVDFLNDSGNANIEDIFNHIDYFLSLSGENAICIGSDFDGASLPKELNDISKIGNLYEFLLKKNYSEKLVDKIFFHNARKFFGKISF